MFPDESNKLETYTYVNTKYTNLVVNLPILLYIYIYIYIIKVCLLPPPLHSLYLSLSLSLFLYVSWHQYLSAFGFG